MRRAAWWAGALLDALAGAVPALLFVSLVEYIAWCERWI